MDTIETDHITRAIELVTEHGVVTGAQLHALLGLEPDDHPSEILAEALEDGRLIKDGKEWMLGAPGVVERVEVITYLPTPEAVAAFPQVSALDGISLVERRKTTRTKVQIAIDLINSLPNRRATNSQMRKALGLSGETPPIAYLRTGLNDGRLARAEYDWVLGEKERMAA